MTPTTTFICSPKDENSAGNEDISSDFNDLVVDIFTINVELEQLGYVVKGQSNMMPKVIVNGDPGKHRRT